MSDLHSGPDRNASESGSGLFTPPPAEPPQRSFLMLVAGAAVLVAIVVLVLVLQGHRSGAGALNAELPLDPYASSLSFTDLAMSQSTSLSGGTSTFIDGRVRNTGSQTLTGVTMQVLFRNDEGLAPQVETLPLSLIRTHEPYVDTEPVSVAPLKPGDEVEFRLIFEKIPTNWNQQLPELRVVRATFR
jgi:hypothetical protein